VIVAAVLLVFIGGFLWICWLALRSGIAFEGEITNRLLSMKFRTLHPSDKPGTLEEQPPTSAGREPDERAPG
jgi:hypothetical protein